MIARSRPPNTTPISQSEKLLKGLALRVLDYEEEPDEKVFERFNQDFFALRLALESHLGPTFLGLESHLDLLDLALEGPENLPGCGLHVTSLSNLFKGAWVGAEAGRMTVMLPSVGTTSGLVDQFPSTRQDLQLGKVYRNGAGLVCLLERAEGGTVMVAYEYRNMARGKKIDLDEFNMAMAKAQGAGDGELGSVPVVLVFVSNRVVDGSVMNDLSAALRMGGSLSHAIIVARGNCVDYFGPSLARRFMGYEEPTPSE